MFVVVPIMLRAQINRTFSLRYNESDFNFVETNGLSYISTTRHTTILKNEITAPALPFICLNVLIGPDESYIDFTSNSTEILLREGTMIAPNPIEAFKSEDITASTNPLPLMYTKSSYPDLQIEFTGTHVINGYKFLTFLVCPFRYDFTNTKLYLNSQINLNIQLNSSKNTKLPVYIYDSSVQKQTNNDSYFINEEHKSILYESNTLSQVTSKNNTDNYPVKYLIITTNYLKNEFERLARWKSIKGIKAKVLTVDSIYSHDTHTDRSNQLKIKYAIKDYYQPHGNGVEYVLLGGDVSHVPVEKCHIQTTIQGAVEMDLTPSDLYYSSFKNMEWDNNHNGRSAELIDGVDLLPDVAITRLPASSSTEANKMISRIIDYEKNATTNNWDNSMLLCGVQTYDSVFVNGREVSDSEMQMDSVYTRYISPNWTGNVFRFYDTYTNHTLGANYNVSSDNLQQELMKGYSFFLVNTHGWPFSWDMETAPSYNTTDASGLNNPHYTIFTTTACNTNDIDHNYTCLGEAFMKNGNGGALAYYGCSRESIGSQIAIALGKDMEYIGTFYQRLFSPYSNYCFGEAIRRSKIDLCANYNSYNSSRWMHLTLNALGDPEMPVFKTIPSAIPNVTINFNGSDLSCTSGVERPKLCLMSKYDEGNNFYYYNYGHGSPFSYDNVFHNMFDEYSFCLTKKGYLPTLAVIGNTVHLQNETLSGKNNIIAYHTLIGSNVTNQTSAGAVIIENGLTVITSRNDVIITRDFEVKQGAELEIKINSQNQVTL